jgi:hypothetical protein
LFVFLMDMMMIPSLRAGPAGAPLPGFGTHPGGRRGSATGIIGANPRSLVPTLPTISLRVSSPHAPHDASAPYGPRKSLDDVERATYCEQLSEGHGGAAAVLAAAEGRF